VSYSDSPSGSLSVSLAESSERKAVPEMWTVSSPTVERLSLCLRLLALIRAALAAASAFLASFLASLAACCSRFLAALSSSVSLVVCESEAAWGEESESAKAASEES
jgi:hypothetical protein